jgi:hypothetical protein
MWCTNRLPKQQKCTDFLHGHALYYYSTRRSMIKYRPTGNIKWDHAAKNSHRNFKLLITQIKIIAPPASMNHETGLQKRMQYVAYVTKNTIQQCVAYLTEKNIPPVLTSVPWTRLHPHGKVHEFVYSSQINTSSKNAIIPNPAPQAMLSTKTTRKALLRRFFLYIHSVYNSDVPWFTLAHQLTVMSALMSFTVMSAPSHQMPTWLCVIYCKVGSETADTSLSWSCVIHCNVTSETAETSLELILCHSL